MQITATNKKLTTLSTDCIIIPIFKGKRTETYDIINKQTKGFLERVVTQAKFTADYNKILTIHTPDSRYKNIILLGLGKPTELNRMKFIKLANSCAHALYALNVKQAMYCFEDIEIRDIESAWILRALAIATLNLSYQYTQTISKKKPKKHLNKLTFHTTLKTAVTRQVFAHAKCIYEGMACAQDLGNLPPNICTPEYIAQQARQFAGTSKKLNVKVLEENRMQRLGMGAFLSVSQGSTQPGKLICIEYKNSTQKSAPIVLVGKGITFDTGGISIKPSSAMDEMKFDMSGAASVMGTMLTCVKLDLPINVVGILACAENMPGGKASKPGDVVTTMSGQTVEILNTDAEGRLVLCDALSYAGKYNPSCVIDIATLTGACVVALGHEACGLLGNHQALIDELLHAGEISGDRPWQLPLWDEYQSQLDSNFADIANIGGQGGGTITAACFLSRFTKKYRWAHLDVAGTAWHSGKKKGSTGRPVPLLAEFLLAQVK